MTIEVTYSPDTTPYSAADLFGSLRFVIFEAEVSRFTTTFFGLTGTYGGVAASVSVNGSGFVTQEINGETYPTQGIISLIDFSTGLGRIRLEDVNIDLSTFVFDILAVENGTNPQAVEQNLLNRAWDVSFGDANDVITNKTVLPEGVIFNPVMNDTFRGGDGNDNLFSGDGDDMLYGDDGRDRLDGGTGDDMIYGGDAKDRMFGRSGKDTLDGGDGNDILRGGSGNDVFVFGDDYGKDTIRDFNEKKNKEDIDLSAVTEITGYRDLLNNHMEQSKKNVVIDDGEGTKIIVIGVNIEEMNKADFLF